jgi:serine/threonine protein kinase
VDRACDAFEAALRAGQQPPIEEYLKAAAETDRTKLLEELLKLELEYRRGRGERLTLEEYLRRFPEHAGRVEAVYREGGTVVSDIVPPAREGPPQEPPPSEPRLTVPDRPPAPAAQRDPSWPTIPGYEILGVLGKGAMGVVYEARHLKLDRRVALKMILAGDQADAEDLQRFVHEAQTVARLHHLNIVQIYEIGEHDGLPYFSLELVDGGTLAKKLAGAPLPPREAAQLMETLARAMHSAHQRGIVHRDLKPANVLLTTDGVPKITDFGLAKRLEGEAGQSLPGAIIGTPSYMAPEQAAGGKVDALADVYGLGAILYELLTGHPPFRGPTLWDTLLQVRTQEPVPPSRFQAKLSRDLEAICLACLEKEPRKRYATAQELADDLRRFLEHRPTRKRPLSTAGRLSRWCRRNPVPASAAAIILVTVVTAIVLIWQSRNRAIQLAADKAELAGWNEQLAQLEHQQAEANKRLAVANGMLANEKGALALEAQREQKRAEREAANALLQQATMLYEQGDTGRALLVMARGLDRAVKAEAADLERVFRANLALWRTRLRGLKVLLPHEGQVLAVAFTPDGKRLITGGTDRTVRIWDAVTGKPVGNPLRHEAGNGDYYPHQGEVVTLAISPNGRTLATGMGTPHRRGRSQLWDPGRITSAGLPSRATLESQNMFRRPGGDIYRDAQPLRYVSSRLG